MDFCAWIGWGRLWLEKVWMECVAFSEINLDAEKTYRLFFGEEERNFWNLMHIDPQKLPDFDLMIAGFPCQTFSVIWQRKWMADIRWQVIYGLVNILKQKNIPFFILENVKWLTNHDDGKSMQVILGLLDDAGYEVSYKVLNSLDYWVPQMRERVYFVWIRKDISILPFSFPAPVLKPGLSEYLKDTVEIDIKEKKESYQTFLKYLANKYNIGKFSINALLNEEYLVIDTRQSDMRLYRWRVPTLRTGRHGILYVHNKRFRKLSGYESLLLQWFPDELAMKAKDCISEVKILWQTWNAMTVHTIASIAKNLSPYFSLYDSIRSDSKMIKNSKVMIPEWRWHSLQVQ